MNEKEKGFVMGLIFSSLFNIICDYIILGVFK